ncbi:hypothetical protein Q648_00246 [Bartonella quintana JK 12]|nr:hypothetical protein Q647_00657 [Bartonella quintana JK 7]ETS18558.1 hypothetical protein Q648_00246 [Bartonella quintana JK 12]
MDNGEVNLIHRGDCWVRGEAMVFDNVQSYRKVVLGNDVIVYDNANICGDAYGAQNGFGAIG